MARSTEVVLQNHLQAFGAGVDTLMLDYSDSSILVAPTGNYRGCTEIRTFFTDFVEGLPDGIWNVFAVRRQEIHGEFAFILGDAKPWIPLFTDTFVIRDGRIMYQTFAAYMDSPI